MTCFKLLGFELHDWVFDKLDEEKLVGFGPHDPHPKPSERWVCAKCGEVKYETSGGISALP